MSTRRIENILDALEPFYTNTEISQKDCQGYLKEIEVALASHGIKLHKDTVQNMKIPGSNCIVQFTQATYNGAAHISLRRYDRRKDFDLSLTVFTEYNHEEKTYVPRTLEVQRKGYEMSHEYR